MPVHRARGIQTKITMFMAGTIRVVIAAKLLKKLILHTLIYSVYLVLKLLPVPVSAQRRHARAIQRLPYLDGFVPASTGNVLAIWREANTQDSPVKYSIVSTPHV